jgi:hypothetical protein
MTDDLRMLHDNPLQNQDDIERYTKDLNRHLRRVEGQVHNDLKRLSTWLRGQTPTSGINWTQPIVKTHKTMAPFTAIRDYLTGAIEQTIHFREMFLFDWDGRLNPDPTVRNLR